MGNTSATRMPLIIMAVIWLNTDNPPRCVVSRMDSGTIRLWLTLHPSPAYRCGFMQEDSSQGYIETIPEVPLTATSGMHCMAFVDLYLEISGVSQAGTYISQDSVDLI